MKPVTPKAAAIAGLGSVLLLGVLCQLIVNSGSSLPRHSWWEAGLIAVVVAALLASGWNIRRYVRSLSASSDQPADQAGGNPAQARSEQAAVAAPSPESARRTLVLAQAAALGGAVLTGWYVAQIVVQVSRLQVPSVRNAVGLLVLLAIEALGLAAAGFVVQKWCVVPEDKR